MVKDCILRESSLAGGVPRVAMGKTQALLFILGLSALVWGLLAIAAIAIRVLFF